MDLGEGLTSIGSTAFRDCKALIQLVVPASVTSAGIDLFKGCIALTEIYYLSQPLANGSNTFHNVTADIYYFSDLLDLSVEVADTNSIWYDLSINDMGVQTSSKIWLVESDYAHDTDLTIGTNNGGVSLLKIYALDLDLDSPVGSMPELVGNQFTYTYFSDRSDVVYAEKLSWGLRPWVDETNYSLQTNGDTSTIFVDLSTRDRAFVKIELSLIP